MKRGKLGAFVFLAWVAGLLSNCGGSSFESDDGGSGRGGENGGSAGVGAASGSMSGGTSSGGDGAGGSPAGGAGGASGTGSPEGGSSGSESGGSGAVTGGAGGTTAGSGMTGGSAGTGGEPELCSLPPDPGPCRAAMPRYFFNPATGVCQPFTYGGCDGNENNFETIEECYGACGGQGEIDPAACQYPTDCTLVPSACCGGCARAELTNMVAVHGNKAAEFSMAMSCHLVDCALCPRSPNPWLGATCRAGRCVAFDARQNELTECSKPEDCRFRAGLTCCEDCNASRGAFIAIDADADLGPWICGDWPGGCAGCVPIVPPNLSVTCGNGRCGVLDAELPQ